MITLITQKTVNDMYKESISKGTALLSEYNSEFWQDYVTNYAKYDALFRRMFFSFRYFMQSEEDDIATITTNFIEDVNNHLMVNDKKYSELYRIHVISDDKYSITDNYNVTEKMQKATSNSGSDTYGERTDSTNETSGARQDTNTTQVGSQTNTGTDTIAGFNSAGFENDSKVIDETSARTDTSETNIGEQNNLISFGKGSQTDTHSGTGTEDYTLTRVGNIGVKTVTEVIQEHSDYWSIYEFYTMIFKEICSELLLI